jgi:clan AA aspartic protease (TIGR02281 family)
MNRLTVSLLLILILSIGFNLVLWYGDSQSEPPSEASQAPLKYNDKAKESEQDEYVSFDEVKAELDVEPLRRLLQKGEYIELGRRLRDALRVLPNNTELLLMEAEFIAKTEPLSDAVLNYYFLLERPLDNNTRVLIQSRIDNLVNKAISPLQQGHQWDLLAQFMEPLFQRMPQNKGYTLLLAEAYGRQSNFSLMESTLAALQQDDPQAVALRERLYANRGKQDTYSDQYDYSSGNENTGNDGVSTVGLVRSGDQFLVDLMIEETPVRMLIDTGASMTALSARTFDRLSDDYESQFLGVFEVNTAGGKIQAPMVTFPKVSLGNYSFSNLTIVIIPTDPFNQAEGLLGMNILKAFDFRIDQQASALLLKEY